MHMYCLILGYAHSTKHASTVRKLWGAPHGAWDPDPQQISSRPLCLYMGKLEPWSGIRHDWLLSAMSSLTRDQIDPNLTDPPGQIHLSACVEHPYKILDGLRLITWHTISPEPVNKTLNLESYRHTLVNWGHMKIFLLLPGLKNVLKYHVKISREKNCFFFFSFYFLWRQALTTLRHILTSSKILTIYFFMKFAHSDEWILWHILWKFHVHTIVF